ncbi:MAG TPA: hypothetical protein VEN29_04730 [Casimicrobiaceae bacterium]|nr:hypothetical protein [Casimicrobiaceae bacterium]
MKRSLNLCSKMAWATAVGCLGVCLFLGVPVAAALGVATGDEQVTATNAQDAAAPSGVERSPVIGACGMRGHHRACDARDGTAIADVDFQLTPVPTQRAAQ